MNTVVITGASRGIGKAAAIAFAKEGYAVAVNYNKNKELATEVINEIDRIKGVKGTAIAVKADVSCELQVKEMFSLIKKQFGKGANVLVNNAGTALYGLYGDKEYNEIKRLFEVNVYGSMLCCKYALPDMISRNYGRIINISSVWGLCGAACEAHYSAAKAAVIGLTKSLAKENAQSGITVNCIAPGVIDTDMNNNLTNEEMQNLQKSIPLKRMGQPYEVADLAVFLASEKAAYITGQVINISGGFLI